MMIRVLLAIFFLALLRFFANGSAAALAMAGMASLATSRWAPTPWQARVLSIPEQYDLALLGGRGGGKSLAIAFLFLRHCEQYGAKARCLYIRQTHAAVEDFAQTLRELFFDVYGAAARYNASEGIWRLPGGGYIELSQLSEDKHYQRFQGRSFSMIACDELTQHPTARYIDLLRSSNRSPKGVPTRFIVAANPGGVGHSWVRQRYINSGVAPWTPFKDETGSEFVTCASVFTDNPHLDHAGYQRQLEAACAGDPELLKAWVEGSWDVAQGAYFSDVISRQRNAFGPWEPDTFYDAINPKDWRVFLAHDFGSRAPSVTYVCAEARWVGTRGPEDRYFAAGSPLLLDELATNAPNSLTEGMGYTTPHLAEQIHEMAERWRMKRAEGVADDAIFAKTGSGAGSIRDEFARCGVYFSSAKKGDRVHGWQKMRRLLQGTGSVDEPGLYVSNGCTYWWDTVPTLPRDPRRVEDVDTRSPDHAGAACRYAVTGRPQVTLRDLYGPHREPAVQEKAPPKKKERSVFDQLYGDSEGYNPRIIRVGR